ncbi:hypothetical protein HZC35_03335 [Candidatus Saganbacteria bacterium]|nr:hypothetical protein [Candidatus Saganbacteria bacterium]
MVAIVKVPGMMFQQRAVTISQGEPAENDNPPPSPSEGGLQGSIGQVWQCTAFSAGPAPTEDVQDAGDYDYFPDAEDQPDTIEVDVDGDGEADLEVTDEADIPDEGVIVEDGDTPDVDEDGDGEVDVDEDGDTVPDGEDADVAEDGEVSGPCDHAPFVDPLPFYPARGATDVALSPSLTFDWPDGAEVDPGDSIASYNLIVSVNPDLSSPVINVTGLPSSEYPVPAGALADATTYYWAMEAVDNCGRVTRSTIWDFTTVRTCLPYTFIDTDFTTGALSGGAINDVGTLRLAEDTSAWTGRYEGDVLPEAAGLTRTGTFSTAPASDGDILTAGTLGTDALGYYETNAGLDNATGWVVEARVRIDGQDGITPPYNVGFTLRADDGRRALEFRIDGGSSGQVCEPFNTGGCYPITTGFHTYRIESQGDNFILYVDGLLAIDGTGMSGSGTSGTNHIRIGDQITNPDSSFSIDYVRWYNLDDQIPYVSPGAYEGATVDTGMVDNDLTGSAVSWNPASIPGAVSVAVRAGNSPDLTAVPWSAELTDNPAMLPMLNGQYIQWRATLTAPSPAVTPVIEDVSGGTICP